MSSEDPSLSQPKTRFDKERALKAAGVAVPDYPRAPDSQYLAVQATSDANLLAACDAWEHEVDRLYEQFLKRTGAHDRL